MQFLDLMRYVGEQLELEQFEPDENGICQLVLEETVITLQYFEKLDIAVISAPISAIPQDVNPLLYQKVCEANFFYGCSRGATFSVDPKSGYLFIARYDILAGLTDERFYSHLLDFVNVFNAAFKRVTAFLDGDTEAIADIGSFQESNQDRWEEREEEGEKNVIAEADGADEPVPMPWNGEPGFMRV